ncbi:protein involved in polysaccharide export with SLBB domain [Rhizomicrobium palustre]|uniref:Protein involved in polysaccharide export with SLBB domain n=1 Tax=Rhizomicrobium palustre TaxID=189966 RepID=A0A846N1A1_9PROT|nr:polysaccharide biosynthesis/export family protein [Rhizomicrobium palustre]NIK89708.1 protein involved in polysaccharide export with SLBB domain [Rhizomicrobium palustre]
MAQNAPARVITPAQLPQTVAQNTAQTAPQYAAPQHIPPSPPHYSVQSAPDDAPLSAPTERVSVAPSGDAARLAPDAPRNPATASTPPAQLRSSAAPAAYSAANPAQNPDEHITISALRQGEDGLYRLGPGDKLHVIVFGEGDLTGDFTIDGQGFVRLPLVGQVQAAGLTSFGLESRIADSLINGGYLVQPRVAVEILSYRPFYILGEVAKPGEYAYVNAMSAPNAIALAGGYTDRAVTDTIYIRHQGESREHELAADETTRIRPGDVVRVRRSTYWAIMTLLSPIISPFATVAYLLK